MIATYNQATDVPVTANGYTASGNTVAITLNFAPATGTELIVVKNTRLGFINGNFDNLAQGQTISLSYGGITYKFVANYYGGNGNDLVLVWFPNRVFGWGYNGTLYDLADRSDRFRTALDAIVGENEADVTRDEAPQALGCVRIGVGIGIGIGDTDTGIRIGI